MEDSFVMITGNVTRDFGLHENEGKTAIGEFGLALNRRYKKGDEWVDDTPTFFDVTVFGREAKNASESIEKGDRVTVLGYLKTDTWKDKTSGEDRSKLKVIADKVSIDLKFCTVVELAKNTRS